MGNRVCPDCGAHLDPGEICDCQLDFEDDKKEAPPSAHDSAPISSDTEEPCMGLFYQMDGDMSSPNNTANAAYYSIIPAPVRYNPGLTAQAKLLYGEISALCNREGFCWATNAYFAKLYGVSDRSIVRMIRNLEEHGFVRSVVDRTPSGRVQGRRLFLGVSAADGQPLDNFVTTPSRQNCHQTTELSPPPDKSVSPDYIYNNININSDNEEKAKRSPFDVKVAFAHWVQTLSEHWLPDDVAALLEAFDGFVESRKGNKKPLKSTRALNLLCNRLRDLAAGNPRTMIEMLNQAVIHGWLSVYPLSNNSRNSTITKGEGDVEWL